jgi:hypothetical protein
LGGAFFAETEAEAVENKARQMVRSGRILKIW